jgi:hypothetical protein
VFHDDDATLALVDPIAQTPDDISAGDSIERLPLLLDALPRLFPDTGIQLEDDAVVSLLDVLREPNTRLAAGREFLELLVAAKNLIHIDSSRHRSKRHLRGLLRRKPGANSLAGKRETIGAASLENAEADELPKMLER